MMRLKVQVEIHQGIDFSCLRFEGQWLTFVFELTHRLQILVRHNPEVHTVISTIRDETYSLCLLGSSGRIVRG